MLEVMARSVEIPKELRGRPFLLDEAMRQGLTRRRLEGDRFRRIFHRVYVCSDVPDSLELRCRAALLVCPPGTVFCGITAARLYHAPLPKCEEEIHVVLPPSLPTVPQTEGIRVHRYAMDPSHFQRVRGLRVLRPASLFLELAGVLHRTELVIAGDHLLNKGWSTLRALTRGIEAAPLGRRGLLLAREALPLLERKADSPMETRLRLIIVDAGLPRPWAGRDAFDDQGLWIGRPDLSYPELKIAIDYEGDHHRSDIRQYRNDFTRDSSFTLNGWRHLKYESGTVFGGPDVIIGALRRLGADRARPGPQTPDDEWEPPQWDPH